MTIDDELLVEIFKPERDGRIGKEALMRRMLGAPEERIEYKIEESMGFTKINRQKDQKTFEKYTIVSRTTEDINVTPDIVINLYDLGTNFSEIAFELENDIQWDFQESLRQIKKYKMRYPDTRVIIPEDYRRFAPLYKNEGITVYLWKAKRRWHCLRCGTETDKEGPVAPRCSKKSCDNKSLSDYRLIGLKDVEIEAYT
jgi:hypothetical protein